MRLCTVLAIAFTLVASLNYCGVLLARAPLYIEEVRLKRVLGASTARLILELVVGPAATVGLGLVGSMASVLASWVSLTHTSPILAQLLRGSWDRLWIVLGFQLILVFIVICIISSVPAIQLVRDSGAPKLGLTTTESKQTVLLLKMTVSIQIACSILACIIGLMIVTQVEALMDAPLGYNPTSLAAISIAPISADTPVSISVRRSGIFPLASVIDAVTQQLAAVPAVSGVCVALSSPGGPPMKSLNLRRFSSTSDNARAVAFNGVTQNYFRTLGVTFVLGRSFSSNWLTGDVTEIVINQALQEELWNGENPLGQTVNITAPSTGIVFGQVWLE